MTDADLDWLCSGHHLGVKIGYLICVENYLKQGLQCHKRVCRFQNDISRSFAELTVRRIGKSHGMDVFASLSTGFHKKFDDCRTVCARSRGKRR